MIDAIALGHSSNATVAEMPDLLTKREYEKLLADLQRIIREGKEEAERRVHQSRSHTR